MMNSSIILLAVFSLCSGYVFDCLDKCECDTEDEVIHCHNGDRTHLTLPVGTRLRGFPVIGLTYNKIQRLPDEETLMAKFPDLQIVDVERNEQFDCATISEYSQIKIISDCEKNISEIERVPKVYRPTKDCDLACQAEKHYKKLHQYVIQLWEIIKQKYENFDLDVTLKSIRDFFRHVLVKVNALGKDIQQKLESSQHPKAIGAHTQLGDNVAIPTRPEIVIE